MGKFKKQQMKIVYRSQRQSSIDFNPFFDTLQSWGVACIAVIYFLNSTNSIKYIASGTVFVVLIIGIVAYHEISILLLFGQ
jgi:hypothetical protein